MTTLRVLIDAVPAAGVEFDYALIDADGPHVASRGRAARAQWPAATQCIAVVAAPLLFVATLKLPPIGAARIADAVRFALDDQLAASADSMHIAHAPQQRGGEVRATALSRELMQAIVDGVPNLARVVAEPALFAADADWHWIFDARGRGFLLRSDASALPLPAATGAPAEIALAIRQARRAGSAPARIVAHARDDAIPLAVDDIDGVAIVRGASWSWEGGTTLAADVMAAPDLRQGAFAPFAHLHSPGTAARRWRPAALVALLALACFALAGIATMASYAIAARADRNAAIALAKAAGADAQDFDTAIDAVNQRYTIARHAARESAPGDALPLLARAAPALAALPAGTWKRAIYASGAWTVEFTALDAAARDNLIARLSAAGLTALYAVGADGVRVRIQS
ncbi:MAG: type II secretion system protein GspL [Casimicrobiaceae bacterium]